MTRAYFENSKCKACKASVTKVSRPENDPKPIYKSRHEINDFAIFYGLSLFLPCRAMASLGKTATLRNHFSR